MCSWSLTSESCFCVFTDLMASATVSHELWHLLVWKVILERDFFFLFLLFVGLVVSVSVRPFPWSLVEPLRLPLFVWDEATYYYFIFFLLHFSSFSVTLMIKRLVPHFTCLWICSVPLWDHSTDSISLLQDWLSVSLMINNLPVCFTCLRSVFVWSDNLPQILCVLKKLDFFSAALAVYFRMKPLLTQPGAARSFVLWRYTPSRPVYRLLATRRYALTTFSRSCAALVPRLLVLLSSSPGAERNLTNFKEDETTFPNSKQRLLFEKRVLQPIRRDPFAPEAMRFLNIRTVSYQRHWQYASPFDAEYEMN